MSHDAGRDRRLVAVQPARHDHSVHPRTSELPDERDISAVRVPLDDHGVALAGHRLP